MQAVVLILESDNNADVKEQGMVLLNIYLIFNIQNIWIHANYVNFLLFLQLYVFWQTSPMVTMPSLTLWPTRMF